MKIRNEKRQDDEGYVRITEVNRSISVVFSYYVTLFVMTTDF